MSETPTSGVTSTERLLAELCDRSFLRLWSYANPYKDDGHEFCDVLAAFENHVFIFFDRKKQLTEFAVDEDPNIKWSRWKRNAIDRQVQTTHGAERYLRSGRAVYLDAKKAKEFPVPINRDTMIVHKIIVAHGAAEACKNFSESNIYGSLAISYGESDVPDPFPFMIHLDKAAPVHVFDSHNLPIILGELDTVKDLADYLDAKANAISSLDMLSYCGEEDLLAHYWLNLDKNKRHFIGTSDPTVNAVMVGEGEWKDLVELPQYIETKKANQQSYLWDEIIQRTCDNWTKGTLRGHGELLSGRGAIHDMAKEPRFMRRVMVERMINAINEFPAEKDQLQRHMCFFHSFYPDKAYVFLQLWVPARMREDEDAYRAKRQEVLRRACGAAKNHNPSLKTVIGIAIDPPKLTDQNAEDFLWMDCSEWPEETRAEYEELNEGWNFFRTGTRHEQVISEFVRPPKPKRASNRSISKVGRNELCPCGSGKKFKKCHGR
ncbi:YecA family protein [Muricoccus radiodurans]|uniref:YecA family protein n=1 Tax=Muricoccus radiodurans TaxID=2231721 RepID=UPI003CFB0F0C